ncbi:transcriptional repressor TraM [Rhizobium binae]|uniref:transcriptional repressor TraM n=1 Tax=Rhizobium binae TaxID=1138190 RepID=UPI001C82DE9C|nr:transcriptional repressor TraM [Rhizobium binae]MBX4962642.1 transcriptional regulator [Rhizobium binae]
MDALKPDEKLEIRAIFGLTKGLSKADVESLAVDAIRTHRVLVDGADKLYQELPEDYKTGEAKGGPQHLTYIKACMEMHAQMYTVNTLIAVLGYIPKVMVN